MQEVYLCVRALSVLWYYVDNGQGSIVHFEHLEGGFLIDAKFIAKKPSAYTPRDMPYAKASILKEARRQVHAASHNGKRVKWKVSDPDAVEQLSELFHQEGIAIDVVECAP